MLCALSRKTKQSKQHDLSSAPSSDIARRFGSRELDGYGVDSLLHARTGTTPAECCSEFADTLCGQEKSTETFGMVTTLPERSCRKQPLLAA